MMTEIEDDDEWATCDELAEDENDNNSVVAESGLDRIACSLGGKTIFPLILATTPQVKKEINIRYPQLKSHH